MAKLDRLGWVVSDWFTIEGYRFGVRTTSHGFGAWLRHTLGEYWEGSGDDDEMDPIYSIVVEDGSATGQRASKRFHIIYYGTWDVVRTLDIRALASSLLNEIDSFTFPIRNDAVYLEASVIRGDGKTLLIQNTLVPTLCAAGRRIASKIGVSAPGAMSVALDPETGHLIPPSPYLKLAPDRWEMLGTLWPMSSAEDGTVTSITDVTPIDRVLKRRFVPHPVLQPTPKAPVLYEYAQLVRNQSIIGGDALKTLAKVFERADVLELQYFSTQNLIEALGAAVGGGTYVGDPPERVLRRRESS
jgi:hypothetical protein